MYAFGYHEKFQEMNKYFRRSFAVKYISLDKPGAFLSKSQAEFLSSKGVHTLRGTLNATQSIPFMVNSSKETINLPTTITPVETTIAARPKTEIKETNKNEGDSKGLILFRRLIQMLYITINNFCVIKS